MDDSGLVAVDDDCGRRWAGVAGVYNRATYLPEKTAALAQWAEHLEAMVTGRPARSCRCGVPTGMTKARQARAAARGKPFEHAGHLRLLQKEARQCRFADHPTEPVTPLHRLVAITRNRWSRSIGMPGRNQAESVVAITRCAHGRAGVRPVQAGGCGVAAKAITRDAITAGPAHNSPGRAPTMAAAAAGANFVPTGEGFWPRSDRQKVKANADSSPGRTTCPSA
jgi:hypothetical protein